MHKAFTLAAIALMAGSGTLQAQSHFQLKSAPSWCANPRYSQALKRLACLNPAAETANKTTGTGQRLIDASFYYNMGAGLELLDSAIVKYGGSRTSKFDLVNLSYSYEYYSDPLTPGDMIDYDTLYFKSQASTPPEDTGYILRNAAGKVTRQYLSQYRIDDYSYDAQGHPTSLLSRSYDNQTMTFTNDKKVTYRYDAQGRLASDSTQYWDLSTNQWEKSDLNVYSYNAANQPIQLQAYFWNGSSYDLDSRTMVTYTAANKFSSTVYQTWDGSAYQTSGKDTFAYGAGNAQIYHASLYDFGGTGLLTATEEFRHLNAANLPDSVTMRQLNDPFAMTYDINYQRLTWNSFGNPVTMTIRQDGNSTLDSKQNYYYASFQTSQGVASAPVRKSLSFFPNPADNQISIRPDFTGHYSLSLLNAAGQTVMSSTGSAALGQAFSLPLGNLAPGQYWMQLQNAEGSNYSAGFQKK